MVRGEVNVDVARDPVASSCATAEAKVQFDASTMAPSILCHRTSHTSVDGIFAGLFQASLHTFATYQQIDTYNNFISILFTWGLMKRRANILREALETTVLI